MGTEGDHGVRAESDLYGALYRGWLRDRVLSDRERTPEVLWHYTTAIGLMGVLNTETFWATDTRFLNDASEIAYGVDTFMRVLRTSDLEGRKPETRHFAASLASDDGPIHQFLAETLAVFVTCFCADGDLLSQWRAYSTGDTRSVGYALGIRSRDHHGWIQTAPVGQHLTLRRVRYDIGEQEATCSALITGLLNLVDADEEKANGLEAFARYLVNGLVEFAASCKHPAFEEENEWRLIYVAPAGPLPVHCRAAGGDLVPYVELSLPEPTGAHAGRLPIKHIRHGPTPDPVRTKTGLTSFLRRTTNFEHVEVLGTDAPLRL